MFDPLDDICNYLETLGVGVYNSAAETPGSIFLGILPADPDDCIAILGLPGNTLGDARDIPALQFPRYNIIVRNKDYDTGAKKFQEVRTALHGKIGPMLNHFRLMRNHAEQDGGPIGEDPQGRFEWSINFLAEMHYVPSE